MKRALREGLTLRRGLVASVWAAATFCAGALAAAPTVNGLFYGDGDESRYVLYNTSIGGSKLWYTVAGNRLYVALVVSRDVNDNVFGNRDYTRNAGWTPQHPANRLVDSEYAQFTLTVGGTTYQWNQGYGAAVNGEWRSDHTTGAGSGAPPPGYESSSSFAWNINRYLTNAAPAWNLYANGTGIQNWKSPFAASAPNTVLGLEGYPAEGPLTFSPTYQWEWPMVYEWSADLSSFGPAPIFVISGQSHHSPAKNDSEDDPFPEPPGNGYLTDYGDLPAPYATLLADDGARHYVVPNGAFLGAQVDPEPDGVPSEDADGDDVTAGADEDGVRFLTRFEAGKTARIEVTAGTSGYLSAFCDFRRDGALEPFVLVSSQGPAPLAAGALTDAHLPQPGTYTLTVQVPQTVSALLAVRFRFTNAAGEGGASPTGLALTGEVEDYSLNHLALSATVDVVAYATSAGVVIDLWTVGESGSGDLTVYAWIAGEWTEVGCVPASEVVGEGSNRYRIAAAGLVEGKAYHFKVVDETGKAHRPARPITVKAIRARAARLAAGVLRARLRHRVRATLRDRVERAPRRAAGQMAARGREPETRARLVAVL